MTNCRMPQVMQDDAIPVVISSRHLDGLAQENVSPLALSLVNERKVFFLTNPPLVYIACRGRVILSSIRTVFM